MNDKEPPNDPATDAKKLASELDLRARELDRQSVALRTKEADLARRESSVVERERAAVQREAEAAAAASKQVDAMLAPLHEAIRQGRQQVLLLDKKRRVAELELEKGLNARSEAAVAELDKVLHDRRAQLAVEVADLADARRRFETEKAQALVALDQERTKMMAAGQQELTRLREELQNERSEQMTEYQRIATLAAARVRDTQAQLIDEKSKAQAELDQAMRHQHFMEELQRSLQQDIDRLQRMWLDIGGGNPEQVRRRFDTQLQTIARLEAELKSRATEEETRQLADLRADLAVAQRDAQVLRQREHQTETALRKYELDAGKLEDLRYQEEVLRGKLKAMEQIIREQQTAYDDLLARTTQKKQKNEPITRNSDEYHRRAADIRLNPIAVRPDTPRPPDEKSWLQDIADRMLESGMSYRPRMLESFHTCLKIAEWAPLTVLSGVSGTGKSELPRLYGRFGGLYFTSVPVQPNWDSPQDVFGFFNYIENRFAARPLLRVMDQSQRQDNGGFAGQMLLVLLDEMNLARIELYLSNLLSRWELRRGEKDDAVSALEFDLGPECPPYPINLRRNVLFAGTINEDELTQALSDKVLDRGNLLYFPRPQQLASRSTLALVEMAPQLPHEVWRGWFQTLAADPDDDDAREAYLRRRCAHYRDVVETINALLGRADRAMGHRVWQAIELYLINHPRVCDASESELPDALRLAFEDQVVQRIVPKLRGLELEGRTEEILQDIGAEIAVHAPALEEDYKAAIAEGQRSFAWRQSLYLEAD